MRIPIAIAYDKVSDQQRRNINTASLADAALPNSRGGQRRMHTLYIPHHDPPYLLMQYVGEIVGVAGGMDGVVERMYKRLHDRDRCVTIERWYDCV
jgi:hypothetical protein